MGKLIHGKTFKMKLLLITLSILLTSSPLFGQETGVLYLWENGTKYMGEWKDGKRHGQGTMTYHDGSKFVGKWKDGRKNGQGTETYPSGRKYEGEWKNNKPWEGTLYDKNENIIGRVVNGEQQK